MTTATQCAADSRSSFPWTFPSPLPTAEARSPVPPLRQGAQRCGVSHAGDLTPRGRGPAVLLRGLAARPTFPDEVARGPQSKPDLIAPGWGPQLGRAPTLPSPARAGGLGARRDRGPRGRGGVARPPLTAVAAAPRRAHDWPLPQQRGRQRGGGARPDAGGKAKARAQAAATAAGDPGGRPRRGGLHGRRHSGDAAAGGAGGARGRDPGTTRPPIPLSASAPSPGVGHPRPIGPRKPGGAPG